MDPNHVKGLIALILGVILLAFWIPMRIRKNKIIKTYDTDAEVQRIRSLRSNTDKLLVDITEAGREITSRIDNKISVLKELIQQADEAANTLGQLKEEMNISPEQPVKDKSEGQQEKFKEIYALADQGLSAKEVAEKLGKRHGEVELILGLRGADHPST